jgi:hypothetical protein
MISRRFATSIEIEADPERIWSVLADVERWPEWTDSITRVERLDGGPFGLGSTTRVEQPRLAPVVWEVTEFAAGVSFSWRTRSSGVTTTGGHHVVAKTGGGATVVLTVEHTGLLAPLVWLFTAGLTRRYVETEARGLKRRSEALDSGR